MAAKVRRMEEDELKNCSPCLVLTIFVAARFYIGTLHSFHFLMAFPCPASQRLIYRPMPLVHTKCLHADVSVNLHSLSYSLHICGYRWPLARLFEIVIRTAVAEHRTPVSESALPVEFYDLRYSVIEISPTLRNWVDNAASPTLSG
jgi:hypothetical protein